MLKDWYLSLLIHPSSFGLYSWEFWYIVKVIPYGYFFLFIVRYFTGHDFPSISTQCVFMLCCLFFWPLDWPTEEKFSSENKLVVNVLTKFWKGQSYPYPLHFHLEYVLYINLCLPCSCSFLRALQDHLLFIFLLSFSILSWNLLSSLVFWRWDLHSSVPNNFSVTNVYFNVIYNSFQFCFFLVFILVPSDVYVHVSWNIMLYVCYYWEI